MSQMPNRPISQKHQHLRAPKLLAQANGAPCMVCGAEDGTVVGAHENGLIAGKGLGIKSDDLPAFLCLACHDEYDRRVRSDDGLYDPMNTELVWLRAFKKSMKWMMQNGKIKVS